MKVFLMIALWASVMTAHAQDDRNVSEYNPNQQVSDSKDVTGLGLYGYDPVSYFPEGGGQPLRGSASIEIDYSGVSYRFSSEENMETFLNDPAKYESTYGGWCAYAMALGSKVNINALIYTIVGNRIHFFRANRPKRKFDADIAGFTQDADDNWKNFSGEQRRL